MDWTNQPELLTIYQEELRERSRRLAEGARSLSEGALPPTDHEDLVRDAHTIKGSSKVMGLDRLAEAGALLEQAWKEVEGGKKVTADLATAMGDVAAMMLAAVKDVEGEKLLTESSQGLVALLAMKDLAGDAVPPPPAQLEEDDEASRENADLGGLVSSIEGFLVGETSSVDSSSLYRMVNLAVEVSLDAAALTDALGPTSATAPRIQAMVSDLKAASNELQDHALSLADGPIHEVTDTFAQFVRYLGRRTGRDIRYELKGDDVHLDRQVLDTLREPLRHLLVNAVDHGIEMPEERVAAGKNPTGSVWLRARATDDKVVINVRDDGRGIDWDAVRSADPETDEPAASLFRHGVTTMASPNELSGDGAGLALVAEAVQRVHGSVSILSEPGQGTTVTLTLPTSLALQTVLIVDAGGHKWGIPEAAVAAHFPMSSAEVSPGEDRMTLLHDGDNLPLTSFSTAVGVSEMDEAHDVVVVNGRTGSAALTLSRVVGRRKVAVKTLGPILAAAPHLQGAAILGGGQFVVVVDPHQLVQRVGVSPNDETRPEVLVVDDSVGVRQLVAATLSSRGFKVTVAANADHALDYLAGGEFDALVVDYSMPGSDGVELVRTVRAARHGMPIVMVSGVAETADQQRAWEAGVDAYIDKFDLRQGALDSTLRSLLQAKGAERQGSVGA